MAEEQNDDAVRLAMWFHEAYEDLAPEHGYKTRDASRKPWADIPETNKALMIATARRVRLRLAQETLTARRTRPEEEDRLPDYLLQGAMPAEILVFLTGSVLVVFMVLARSGCLG